MNEASGTLVGSVALVTGAGQRLGRAIAGDLAGQGADVAVHYFRSAEQAAATAGDVQRLGRRAWTLGADLADPAGAGELMERAIAAAGGPVDILINSASTFLPSRLMDVEPAEIDQSIHLHALAPLLLSRALARQGRPGGRIINMLDARMVDYDRDHAAYHLGKRMLLTLTRMLALELAPAVRVNAVAPGAVLPAAGSSPEQFEEIGRAAPLQRVGSPADVLRAVRFLLDSPFITGQVIYVDGGRHMRGNVYG